MSQSTVTEPGNEPVLISLPDGTTIAVHAHSWEVIDFPEETAEACHAESESERMIHRYADMLDDLNDVATSILMEASANGHTALQRSFINILNIACSVREWLNAEERRMRERGEAER